MRPLKFRAWSEEAKEMYFPEFIWGNSNGLMVPSFFPIFNNSSQVMMKHGYVSGYGVINVGKIPSILMQFTGKIDKNGNEIYEGDRVQYKKTADYLEKNELFKGIIIFNENSYAFEIKHDHSGFISGCGLNHVSELEVIGNIYEK